MDFTRQIEEGRRALLVDIFRRIEQALQPFAYTLDWFLATLFSGRLPADWRQQWHEFVADQATKGFFVAPQSVRELEDWIEAWARYCELLPITETQPVVKAESVAAYRPLVANVVPNTSPPPPPPETDGMSVEERNHLLQFARRCAYLEQQRIEFSDDEWAQYEYYLYQNILRHMRSEPPLAQLQCWIDHNDAFNQKRRGPTRPPRETVNSAQAAEPKSSESTGPFVQAATPNAGGPPEPGDKPPQKKAPLIAATKQQLPADRRGTWISGTKGNGVFRYYDSAENRQAGVAGKKVQFQDQHIALGGFPAEAYYGGSAAAARVEIESVTGTAADNLAADAAMRKKLGDPAWQRPKGYLWNHAGPPGSKALELVDEKAHVAIAHKGSAAAPRSERRRGKGTGGMGRALAVANVYLTAREALQAGGIFQPEYIVVEWAEYYFVADDGSVFTVQASGWFRSAMRVFVAGGRKGNTERISNEQVEEYRKKAEEKWGKYIPGTLFSQPRFIPGTERTSIPFYEYPYGFPQEAGLIDGNRSHPGE